MNSTYEDKHDAEFVATVADPVRRTTAIASAIKKRTKLIWLVGIVTLGFFAICYFGSRQPDAPLFFIVILLWMQLSKCEADLRLLRVIDRLQSYDRPVA
jgi:fatty acid desaturase